jgi:cytoskeletal protein RodZ
MHHIHNERMRTMYNNQPNDPYFPPAAPGTFSPPPMSPHFNDSMWSPSFNEQNTFGQFPAPSSPYQPPSQPLAILTDQQHQPDLERFQKKQRGSMTSRMASLQILRQQVQQQGLPTHDSMRETKTQGDLLVWLKSLNNDMKVALASICVLLFLLLSVGVIALAGGFQDAQSQTNPQTPPSNNSNAPLATATPTTTKTATPTSTPTATATTQATTTEPTQQPANVAQPIQQPTDVPQPTDTPVPTPTQQPIPTVVPTPTVTPPPPPPPTPPNPTPTAPVTSGVAPNNPWGFDFNPGQTITNPPALFCSYFPCTTNFMAGTGYVVECSDGLYSLTGNTSGACSGHGSVQQILYKHG